MNNKKLLSHTYLKEILRYSKNTGDFTWIKSMNSRAQKGNIAGCTNKRGYVQLAINKEVYRAHRLAWFYIYGKWPEKSIDHINGEKGDNRISNLREATVSENACNSKENSRNTSGYRGVHFCSKRKLYIATIQKDGVKRYLGSYNCAIEASNKYKAAASQLHGEFVSF